MSKDWKKTYQHTLVVLLALFLLTNVFVGCNSTSSKQVYEEPLSDLGLVIPSNWEVETNDRLDNFVVLKYKSGLFEDTSARIEIFFNRSHNFTPVDLENMENDIDRIRRLYNLESVTIIQKPSKNGSEDYEIATAIISIPTIAIPDESPINQMGRKDSNLSQPIELYDISSNDYFFSIYVYKGNNNELNAQTDEIMRNILFKD